MRVSTIFLTVGCLATPALASDEAVEVKLDHKSYSKWSIILPAPKWHAVGTSLPIRHAQGEGFFATKDGPALVVDTDGDRKPDAKIRGLGGFAKISTRGPDGGKLVYGVRFRLKGNAWQWAASGVMQAKVLGTTIRLIDANGNGRYDDFGSDAMVVGSGKAASWLSKVVNIKDSLYNVEIADGGHSLKLVPYEGDSGLIDLRAGFKSKGKLASAVVNSSSGDYSFNALQARAAFRVPTGRYNFAGGLVTKGKEQARIAAGRMEALEVEKDQTATLKKWGGKVVADFNWSYAGGNLTVAPNVRYYGEAGEEYVDWVPDNKSPKILVFESGKKRPIESGRFAMC